MKKCDFCTQSDQNGKCFWSAKTARENYCKEAIKQMVKALGQETKENKKRFWQ